MKSQISLSICIAVYNHAQYIKQCLDSLYKFEAHESIEWIIVNDKSTDQTDAIIRKWISTHPIQKITYLNNEKNLGQVKTLAKAVKHSQGEFVTFMDSDDFLIRSSLQKKLSLFKKRKELKVYYANGIFFRKNKKNSYGFHDYLKPILNQKIDFISRYLKSNTPLLSLSCTLFRKSFFQSIGGFDESGFSNDWITNIKIFKKIKKQTEFYIDYTPVFAYRIHDNNISKNPDLQLKLLTHVIEKYCLDEAKAQLYEKAYFVTLVRYKMLSKTNEAHYYLKLLQKSKTTWKLYTIGFLIILLPSCILKTIEPIIRDIKHFFKGKLF